ncbi:hypothetical protein [Lactiplantibacillus fabifermentans]|uniref:Uncharacterized protein n=2 Tax=Lactiplantibacillus fabifermentans TaxID=483011 RepID=A0A0R2NVL0_9LACO|nr:hypothetical protein [Lactiplantibacillus fabifermentans]ETY75503.1 hypothetical protein LFAB_01445 [Lactiplantibacillus fabifermentans T30PCM01]KRO27130.1 hypothetical protein DY78_GL000322 [Lactiplantibacillus fabifermentans DSM 21115]
METGILKAIDLKTAAEQYFFVTVQRYADWILVKSLQSIKPFELLLNQRDLRVSAHHAVAACGNQRYEFNDDTGGLITQLSAWAG